jgi:hypothetical protein
MVKLAIGLAIAAVLAAAPVSDPYGSLAPDEKTILKPQIERWIRDQEKHNWADMWEIQDQTSELKNELLLGRRDAPDMDRSQYVQAMQSTIGVGYPEIRAFTLREIRREDGGFWILGCGKQQREAWKQTSITNVHVRIVSGKVMFGLPAGTPEPCKL